MHFETGYPRFARLRLLYKRHNAVGVGVNMVQHFKICNTVSIGMDMFRCFQMYNAVGIGVEAYHVEKIPDGDLLFIEQSWEGSDNPALGYVRGSENVK